ncbi:conjugative transposon protein TraM [Bacteroides pyogenes]|jgi:hypothetical protein|uniref:Conjugative transposon protein TraM n=1 Tax=Bacteroides pyogenes TaxID=310300 RepID=A0A5D3E9J2_9BACE|nr:conjugative transposon protein TraM [Bacteroides pyogenes]TYK32833.1 conjugative transposon protein TraM [Bacteroides pyogenes]
MNKDYFKGKNLVLIIAFVTMIAVVASVVYFKYNETKISPESSKATLLEPMTIAPDSPKNKIDAYEMDNEEQIAREKQQNLSRVKPSDFYFDMEKMTDEYHRREAQQLKEMETDLIEDLHADLKSESSLSESMRNRLQSLPIKEDMLNWLERQKERIKESRDEAEIIRLQNEIMKKLNSSEEDKTSSDSTSFPEMEKEILPGIVLQSNGKRKRIRVADIEEERNLIAAAIYGDQIVVSGSPVQMILLQDLVIRGQSIPRNTIFSGKAQLGADRLKVVVKDIRFNNYITPVSYIIYDTDAIEGLNLPNSLKAEINKKMSEGITESVQLPISSIGTVASEVTSAISATTQIARQLIAGSLNKTKVHLKAGYKVYIKEETNDDRRKRMEEENRLNALYEKLIKSANNPKQKDFSKIIEKL